MTARENIALGDRLDAEAEHEVHTRLRRHRSRRTSLLISHRLGTLRDADVIVVLAGGTVAESGSHRQLLDRGGVYQRLYRLQARYYRESGEPAEAAR